MADTNLDITVTSKGIKEAQAALKKLETEAANAEKASKKLADAAKKLEDKFKLEAAAIGKTADQVKILKLEQSGATKAQIEAAKSALSYKEKTLQAAKAADQAAKEQQQLAASLLKSQAAAEKLRKVNLKASLLAEAKAADKLEKEQLQLAAATNKTAVAAKNLAVKQQGTHKATTELRGGFRAMRGSTQQVSYQLQDIAVQAQMGTSAFIILGQQGPQLASVFGPGGAVLGAIIAFAAMVGGTLVAGLSDAEEEVDGLSEALDRLKGISDKTRGGIFALSDEFAKLSKESKALAELEIALDISRTERGLEKSISKIEEAFKFDFELNSSFFQGYLDFVDGVAIGSKEIERTSAAGRGKVFDLGFSLKVTGRQAAELGLAFAKFKEQRTPELFTELQDTVKKLRKETSNTKDFDEFAKIFVDEARNIRLATGALKSYEKIVSQIESGPIKSVSDIEGIETQSAAIDKMIAEQIALIQTADQKFFASQDARENKVREAAMRGVIDAQKAEEALQAIEQASLRRFQESTEEKAKFAIKQGEVAFKAFRTQADKQKKEEEKALEQRIAANALISSILSQEDDKRLSQFERYQQKKASELAQFLDADMISMEAYYAALGVLETQYGDLVNKVRDEKERADLASNARELQRQADLAYAKMSLVEKWMLSTQEAIKNVDAMYMMMAVTLESSIATAFEGILTGTMTVKEAFIDFTKSMLTSFLSMIAQMAAKRLALFLVEKMIGKTTAASAATYMAATAAATSLQAGLAAFASTAAIPIYGPAAAPAAMATAIGITAPLAAAVAALSTSAAAARATGGQVRGGQSYLVGERGPELLTMGGSGRISSNDQLKNAVGGGGGITIVNNVDARGADASVDVKIRKAMQETAATTIETIRDLSRRRRFI